MEVVTDFYQYEICLNGQPQQDVAYADSDKGIVVLFEHDREGNRIPWYDLDNCMNQLATITCKGEVTIRQIATEEKPALVLLEIEEPIQGHRIRTYELTKEVRLQMVGKLGITLFQIDALEPDYRCCRWLISSSTCWLDQSTLKVILLQTPFREGSPDKQLEQINILIEFGGVSPVLNTYSKPTLTPAQNLSEGSMDLLLYRNVAARFDPLYRKLVLEALNPFMPQP